MKKKSTSQSAFFNLRILTASVFCLLGIAVALFAQGNRTKQTQQTNRSRTQQDAPGTQRPDVVQMVGPVRTTTDLAHLPYIPNEGEIEQQPLTRYPRGKGAPPPAAPSSPYLQKLLKNIFRPTRTMPGPLLTFEGVNSAARQCGCLPPDTDGDVGPNHYVEGVNVVFKVFDKNGGTVAGPTTFNSLFAPLVGTPCSGLNAGDPFVFYDHQADRWVISDFAFATFPSAGPFYQCIAVSTSPDPAGTYNLYALQHEPSHITWLGDYPKFAMWNDGGTQDAYFFTVNLFQGSPSVAFEGVRACGLDRESMIGGGPANAICFTVPLAGVGDSYSFVAANFRTGDPPPAGRDEMVLAVDSPASNPTTLTQVHARFFHVDFVTPANSTFGVGANHTPNAEITVDPFVEAWTNTAGFTIVPQSGTGQHLDSLGDKIMTPVATPTALPGGCSWSAGAPLPTQGVRQVGVYFPANGKFYSMGGRSSDVAGSEFTNPFEYDPIANTWTTKSATYPDTHVNNMACGVLNDAGTDYIYCVGGSQVTIVGTFDRVFRYDPVTDVISPVAAPWPGGLGMVLPGGFTVFNNKLFILGGFDTITGGGQ